MTNVNPQTMNNNLPNKLYVLEYKGDNNFGGKSHRTIVVAASDSKLAKDYVAEKIGFIAEPIWLMNAVYPTIYTSNGSRPADIQAKILSNTSFHTYPQ